MIYQRDMERFFANVQKTESCWIWVGKRDPNSNYGLIWMDGKFHNAHEVSFQIENGSAPRDSVIQHSCGINLCVNPEHLFLTNADTEINATKFLTEFNPELIQAHKEYVYFIKSESGPIKIGWSRRPSERLKQLQISNPHKLKIIASIPGTKSLEQKIHRSFSRFNIISEWFLPEKEILDFIEQINALKFKEVQINSDWEDVV